MLIRPPPGILLAFATVPKHHSLKPPLSFFRMAIPSFRRLKNLLASTSFFFAVTAAVSAPIHLVEQSPTAVTRLEDGTLLFDFGRVAFGNLALTPTDHAPKNITVHLGEAFAAGRIVRTPPGTVRYVQIPVAIDADRTPQVIAPPADKRNTDVAMNAVLTPTDWGVVLPFRWVEIEGWPVDQAPPSVIRRAAFAQTWQDDASSFKASDDILTQIWELCRYSIKATTFAGVYVDGDRERIPYEADAYLNQISHYYTDSDPQMSRDTYDYLMKYPTWPTEWSSHMIFMAHADWMRTGDRAWLAARYEALKPKLLMERARADGLLENTPEQIKKDLVDWPKDERDGFEFRAVNTVVNAFYIRSLVLMAELAQALDKTTEAADFAGKAKTAEASFQRVLFDARQGRYIDGEGSAHSSIHANLFPLAFGLVPVEQRPAIVAFIEQQGMRCSVYAAQYLLEGLFLNDASTLALDLMLAPGDRSWRHMLASGTTITWEAWEQHYKPNQDWNHAWGAAPANLLPRFVLGVEPVAPGWKEIVIRPQTGRLASSQGRVPTLHGPVNVVWTRNRTFQIEIDVPAAIRAQLVLPFTGSGVVTVDGSPVEASRHGNWLTVEGAWSGRHRFEVK